MAHSSVRGKPSRTKGDAVAIVSYRWDDLPPFTAADKVRLRALAEAPDDEIDFSDIPRTSESQLARMRPHGEVMAQRRARREAAAHT